MPQNPIVDAFQYLFSGSPQQGRGLLSPGNVGDAMNLTGKQYTGKAPLEPSAGMPGSPIQMPSLPPEVLNLMDLGRININKPAEAATVPQIPPSVPQGAMNPQPPTAQPQQKSPMNWQMLADLGIPALSALIGTVAPGTLAGAAGFSKGYTDTREKQKESEAEKQGTKDFIVVDPDTGEQTVFKVPKTADVQQKRAGDLLSQLLGAKQNGDGSYGLDVPDTKTGESLKSNKLRVRNMSTGETGTIDSNEFDSSLYEKL